MNYISKDIFFNIFKYIKDDYLKLLKVVSKSFKYRIDQYLQVKSKDKIIIFDIIDHLSMEWMYYIHKYNTSNINLLNCAIQKFKISDVEKIMKLGYKFTSTTFNDKIECWKQSPNKVNKWFKSRGLTSHDITCKIDPIIKKISDGDIITEKECICDIEILKDIFWKKSTFEYAILDDELCIDKFSWLIKRYPIT